MKNFFFICCAFLLGLPGPARLAWAAAPAEDCEYVGPIQNPVTGIVCEFWENGNLEYRISYVNGRRDGVGKSYYESGRLKAEFPYANGRREGVEKIFYENGQLKSEIPYVNNWMEGMQKAYYKSGKLKIEAPWADDELEGVAKWYHENGKLKAEAPFINNRMSGVKKEYYENGKLKFEAPYDKDRLHGVVRWYHENEELEPGLPFVKDKLEGEKLEGVRVTIYEHGWERKNENPYVKEDAERLYREDDKFFAAIEYDGIGRPVRGKCRQANGTTTAMTDTELEGLHDWNPLWDEPPRAPYMCLEKGRGAPSPAVED